MPTCRSCSSTRLELILDLGDQPWGNNFIPIAEWKEIPRYPLQLFYCNECSMVQLGHTVPKETMFVEHQYVSRTTRSLREHFSRVVAEMRRRVTLSLSSYVLDIGGNDGTFLAIFKQHGAKVLNVDSGKLQARLSEESGVPCINRFFNERLAKEILQEKGRAELIHGSGIFFHLEELHSVFDGIKALLDPNGVLTAEFIYLPEMVKNVAFDQIYHEHLLYYTLSSFDGFLRRHGLAIYDAQLEPIHGGSCIAFIRHAETAQPTPALQALMAQEREEGFCGIARYKDFAVAAARLRDDLVGMVRGLRAEGKTIQALGAPVKGSTIINYCGFTERDLDCAVEINPHKYDTYYPGTRIPVYAQDRTPAPDIYLMLAWNFKDEILAKLGEFRARGGRVLVPIPEAHLV